MVCGWINPKNIDILVRELGDDKVECVPWKQYGPGNSRRIEGWPAGIPTCTPTRFTAPQSSQFWEEMVSRIEKGINPPLRFGDKSPPVVSPPLDVNEDFTDQLRYFRTLQPLQLSNNFCETLDFFEREGEDYVRGFS